MPLRDARLVAVTFLLDIRVDLGLDPGLAVPPIGRSIGGYPKYRIYLVGRPDSISFDVDESLSPFQAFFEGMRLTLDPQVDWQSLTLSGSVAAVTVLHPTHAATFRATDRWMTRRLDEAVTVLDRVLTCIGFLARVPDVGALRRSDFPASVLVVINDSVMDAGNRDVVLTEMQLHSFEEWRSALAQDGLFETAAWLADQMDGDGAHARLFVEYAHRASRDLLDGRPDQAVISATTAVETLTSAILVALWRLDHESPAEIRRRLGAGFKNLLLDHLRPYLEAGGADETLVDNWLSGCYRLRNSVVHEGAAIVREDASSAVGSTIRLGVVIAETLRRDTRTSMLGDAIPLRSPTQSEAGLAEISRLLGYF